MNLHLRWGGGGGELGEKISDITSTGTKVAEGTSGGGGACVANIRPYGYHIGYHDTCPITGLLFELFCIKYFETSFIISL